MDVDLGMLNFSHLFQGKHFQIER